MARQIWTVAVTVMLSLIITLNDASKTSRVGLKHMPRSLIGFGSATKSGSGTHFAPFRLRTRHCSRKTVCVRRGECFRRCRRCCENGKCHYEHCTRSCFYIGCRHRVHYGLHRNVTHLYPFQCYNRVLPRRLGRLLKLGILRTPFIRNQNQIRVYRNRAEQMYGTQESIAGNLLKQTKSNGTKLSTSVRETEYVDLFDYSCDENEEEIISSICTLFCCGAENSVS